MKRSLVWKVTFSAICMMVAVIVASISSFTDLNKIKEAARDTELTFHEAQHHTQFYMSLSGAIGEAVFYSKTLTEEDAESAQGSLQDAQIALQGFEGGAGVTLEHDALHKNERALFERVSTEISNLLQAVANGDEQGVDLYFEELQVTADELNDDAQESSQIMEAQIAIATETVGARLQSRLIGSIFTYSIIAVVIVVVLIVTRLLIVRPIKTLSKAVVAVAGGNLDRRVSITNKDEIGDLQHAFNTMIEHLDSAQRSLEERNESLQESLEARERAMQALAFERYLLDSLMGGMPASIYFKDSESKFTRINQNLAESMGLTGPEEAVGKSDFDFFSEELARASYEDEQEIMRTGTPILGKEEREVWPDGQETWVLTSKMPLWDAEGRAIGTFGMTSDISERKMLDRMKNEFISTVSHELRTPLTSIRGSLGLIAGGVAGEIPSQAKAMIDIAYSNSERLVRLINDILDIEKIESGKMVFDLKPVRLMPIVEQAIESNRGFGEQYGVHIVLNESVPDARVGADSDRLMQVLTNLLSNAVKFSPRGGKVEIAVTRLDDQIRLAVADHGPGIPEEFKARMFQRFAQADSSDTRQKGGTGLGLSISKAIVDRFGGHLSFETTTGQGTTFYVDLPALSETEQSETVTFSYDKEDESMLGWVNALSRLTTGPLKNSRQRVLICEDDHDIAKLLSIMLERSGFSADVAYDAAQAKAMLAERKYAAMTLDLMLPGQDGISFVKELCDKDGHCPVPIVVVSANTDAGKKQINGQAMAIMDWLNKPIDPERLTTAVRRASRRGGEAKPQILHVEDDLSILKVVATLLENVANIAAARTLVEARSMLLDNHFDLVLLDLSLPDGSGLDLLPYLNGEAASPTPIVLFSALDVEAETSRMVDAALVKARTTDQLLVDTITSLIGREAALKKG